MEFDEDNSGDIGEYEPLTYYHALLSKHCTDIKSNINAVYAVVLIN